MNLQRWILLIFATLLTSCSSANPAPTLASNAITIPAVTNSPTPSEARLKSQCLTLAPTLSSEIASSGVIVLNSTGNVDEGHYKPGTHLLNLATGKTTTVEYEGGIVISSDRTLMADDSITLNQQQDRVLKHELIMADATGRRLKVLPWKDEWQQMLGWLDNQHLLLSLQEHRAAGKPYTLLIFNPFDNQQQRLRPDFSKFLDIPGLTQLPYWDGQYGVVYDPTLRWAIYPRFIGDDQKMYTYALWDVSKQKLIASLEEIFSADTGFNDIFPIPHWSPDGSQFVFSGLVDILNKDGKLDHVERDLYQVSHDGQVKQLTHLYPYGGMLDAINWSPNGRYLAGFLVLKDTSGHKPMITSIDTLTLDVMNYCIPVFGSMQTAPQLSAPIWSPDGKQFLVSDQGEAGHWRVILVDIEKNTATQIATDMEAVGWMTKEP